MATQIVDDPDELAELFRRDPHIHIYALADLEEPYWSASTWWRNGDAAIGFVGMPDSDHGIIYAVSSANPSGTLDLIDELAEIAPAGLVTGVTGCSEIYRRRGHTIIWHRGYHRFHLTDRDQVPDRRADVVSLGRDDLEEIEALYATDPGAAFFLPSMIDADTFVGVREGNELVAVAGTHVLSNHFDVAAIGAVYTRPDHRGKGLGTSTTAGVIDRIGDRVSTIGLNSADRNAAARHIYLAMGFREALGYEECEISGVVAT